MAMTSVPPWLERTMSILLGAEPQDTRLGDLSEQHARTVERFGSRVAAGLHYAGAATNVVLFARIIDPVVRFAEGGAVGLLERLMNAMRRLAMPAVLLACSAFLVFSAVGVWQDWRQNEAMLQAQQRDKAAMLVQRVEGFVADIQRQVGWVTGKQWASLPVDQRRFDYVRLLRQVPPITELAYIDSEGLEQLRVSRLSMDVIGGGTDRSSEPAYSEAKSGRTYFGPVYFRRGSEPYLTIGVGHGGSSGVTVAATNLKSVFDVVCEAKVGNTGYAYIVDGQGRLVAHPDIAIVLRGTDMKGLPQVAAAFSPTGNDKMTVGKDRTGADVWSVQAPLPALGWRVFVDLPVAETRESFWMAMGRAAGLLVLALAAAWFAFRLGMRHAEPSRLAQA